MISGVNYYRVMTTGANTNFLINQVDDDLFTCGADPWAEAEELAQSDQED